MNTESTNKCEKFNISSVVASGFGSGLIPKAPGTVGSIVACIIVFLFFSSSLGERIEIRLIFFILLLLVGYWATNQALKRGADNDPGWIVIDEWLGMTLALIPIHPGALLEAAIALVLFRIFDITKPGPIAKAEELNGAFGVILDDLIAGVFSTIGVICLGLL